MISWVTSFMTLWSLSIIDGETCVVNRLEKEYSTIRTKELEEQVELRVNKIKYLTRLIFVM